MTPLAPSLAIAPEPARVHGDAPADEVTRVRLGASIDSSPDLLAVLAVDPAVTVRAAVALNAAAPVGAVGAPGVRSITGSSSGVSSTASSLVAAGGRRARTTAPTTAMISSAEVASNGNR